MNQQHQDFENSMAELRRDMAESSAWARAELARRRNERK